MIPWDDLRVLLAAHRSASLTRAAAELDVSVSTVSRRLAAFEEVVGQVLFVRTPDGLVPTAAATALVPHAESIERVTRDAERALIGLDDRPAGTVRLTAPDDMTNLVLFPALPELLDAHPGLRIALVHGFGLADLTRREADLAVRVSRPERGDELIATRLRDVGVSLYATERYLASIADPTDPAAHRWIHCPSDPDAGDALDDWQREVLGFEPTLRVGSLTAVRLAVAAGIGIAVVPDLFAAVTAATDGRPLVRVPLAIPLPPPLPLFLVTHRAIRHTA
ncbi:MAG: LysR family transcriptional regulator, partial [Myxococcota bacterium]